MPVSFRCRPKHATDDDLAAMRETLAHMADRMHAVQPLRYSPPTRLL